MSILVNFEDTYGMADIACYNFFWIPRIFMNDYGSIEDTYNIMSMKKYLKYNETLFKWLLGGSVSNTADLLNSAQALELQKDYNEKFKQFLDSNKKEVIIQGMTYDLNKNYN